MPRGGARPNTGGSHGGGRPRTLVRPVKVLVRLDQDRAAFLDAEALARGVSKAEVVRLALDALKGEGKSDEPK